MMKKFGFFAKDPTGFDPDARERELRQQMRDLRDAIEQAQLRFDLACDELLVDSCIFELNALSARYRFLVRQAKQLQEETRPAVLV